MKSESQSLGNETKKVARNNFSSLNVSGLDPNMEYSFRLKSLFTDRGCDEYGYVPVSSSNYNGETWEGPESLKAESRLRKSIVVGDTVLCKRTKEAGDMQRAKEDMKYNAAIRLVKRAAPNAKSKMRQYGDLVTFKDESRGVSRLKQRPGLSAEE